MINNLHISNRNHSPCITFPFPQCLMYAYNIHGISIAGCIKKHIISGRIMIHSYAYECIPSLFHVWHELNHKDMPCMAYAYSLWYSGTYIVPVPNYGINGYCKILQFYVYWILYGGMAFVVTIFRYISIYLTMGFSNLNI